jgi:hypothetical protein
MQGRRIPNPEPALCEPGDYYKDDKDGSWHGQTPNGLYCWHGQTPNGLYCWLKNHHVEEHEDGTITVVAGPWGSNSILASNGTGNKSWHGYIRRGVWEEC